MEMADDVAIALQGCIHGEMTGCLESLMDVIHEGKYKVSLLLWSGDVQTVRNKEDLTSLACPPKFRALKDFHHYYDCEKLVPCLTLFIGGNHESSAFLHPLWFGGWVAPNMYYLGRSGVVTASKVRIAGLSGIYKSHDFHKAYYEEPPFNTQTVRSVYHVRDIEVKRLDNIRGPVNLVLTHDWPTQIIQNEADRRTLLRKKPYFRDDLQNGRLGNPYLMKLLKTLKPHIWVAAHLHVNFICTYKHEDDSTTCFVTHDKPKKKVSTSILEVESKQLHFCYQPQVSDESGQQAKKRKREGVKDEKIYIDLEWLLILRASWVDVTKGSSSTHSGPETFIHTWQVAKELALLVEGKGLADWWSDLQQQQGDAADHDEIPASVELWKYTFPYPSWDTLDFRAPWKQTAWWFEILGIPATDIHPPFKAPGGNCCPADANPLLDP